MATVFTNRISIYDFLGIKKDCVESDNVDWIKRKCIEHKGNFSLFKNYFLEACRAGSIKIVKYYLERCVINVSGYWEEKAFYWACEKGNLRIATMLVNYGFHSNRHNLSEIGKLVRALADKDIEDLNELYQMLAEEGYSYIYPIETFNNKSCIKIVKYDGRRLENMADELYF